MYDDSGPGTKRTALQTSSACPYDKRTAAFWRRPTRLAGFMIRVDWPRLDMLTVTPRAPVHAEPLRKHFDGPLVAE